MEDNHKYRSISAPSTAFLKEGNSKFYGFAFPVSSEEDIQSCLSRVQEIYPGASHYCYAWRLGKTGEKYRANDDGEPSNSAGQPIYRQLLSADVTNVLVVVVRFYGGKKLGVAGLISAYGGVAELTLKEAKVIEVEEKALLQIREILKKDYLVYSFVNRYGGNLIESPQTAGGWFTLEFGKLEVNGILDLLKELPNFEWQMA